MDKYKVIVQDSPKAFQKAINEAEQEWYVLKIFKTTQHAGRLLYIAIMEIEETNEE